MNHAVSATGLAFIQKWEGYYANPAQLPDGAWVVGHGHVRTDAPGGGVTEAEAADLLGQDLAAIEKLVNGALTQSVSQAQFDALVSFAWSIGAASFLKSQVLRRLNAGSFVAAACAMDAWRKSDVTGETEISETLVRRRAAEKVLFLGDSAGAPSSLLRPQLDYAASVLGAPAKFAETPALTDVVVAAHIAAIASAREIEHFVESGSVLELTDAQRLTKILMSEPATAVVLAAEPAPERFEEEDELVTAHAKPVARKVEELEIPEVRRINAATAVESERRPWPRLAALRATLVAILDAYGIWRSPKLQPSKF